MTIITLCGSFTFAKRFLEVQQELEAAGMRVLTPSMDAEQQYKEARSKNDPQALIALKHRLIIAHLERIKECDAVLVVNEEKHGIKGYVGANTLMELGAALVLGKKLFLLHKPAPNVPGFDEISALEATVLDGSIEILKNQKEKL